MKIIDKFLNSITMYRLLLYGLSILALYAFVASLLGGISFSLLSLIGSLIVLLFVSFGSNVLISKLFGAPTNVESSWITAFILFFILQPATTLNSFLILAAAAFIAMASKYVFAIGKKHIFNPAAIAAVILGLLGNGSVIWWVGSLVMAPIVLILGLLLVRKIKRFPLFLSFVAVSLIAMQYSFHSVGTPVEILKLAFTSFPLIFFASVMLTEPLTAPATKRLQVAYGVIVALLFSIPFHFGPLYSTPEVALVIGNIFAYIVSPKRKYILTLVRKNQLSSLIHEFVFATDYKVDFLPGQYFEWTLPHENPDTRGNRRYFTIASSPTEPELHLGVRIQDGGSSFKKKLLTLKEGDQLMAGSLSGEFTLPKDTNAKLVFIAGGIGVTPFRSMVKYLIDMKEKREVTLFYACANENDFVYTDLFNQAATEIGLNTVRVVTDTSKVTEAWKGKTGFITKDLIAAEVPDFLTRLYYLSGPDAMVQNYKKMLLSSGVPRANIKTDYFPGF